MSESARLLGCPYCGVKSFVCGNGVFRYRLPELGERTSSENGGKRESGSKKIYLPYLRFKGNVFMVTPSGITYKILDTTRMGHVLPGLPPSLGLRPQAMQVQRLLPESGGHYLRLTSTPRELLEQVAHLLPRHKRGTGRSAAPLREAGITVGSHLENISTAGGDVLHRAFIGETVSYVYLPLDWGATEIMDGVTGDRLFSRREIGGKRLQISAFNPRWQISFRSTLCPRCGWTLEGEGDTLVMHCGNCDTAWALGEKELEPLPWQCVSGDQATKLYLGFWKIVARVSPPRIDTYGDFIRQTNQPMVVRPEWEGREMQYLVPAFKLKPKSFLRVGRQTTMGQWRLRTEEGRRLPHLFPVTLPLAEARQAVPVLLATSSASRKKIFPFLPRMKVEQRDAKLVYLPFVDKGHDWYQPHCGVSIAKTILRFGRSL